MVEQTVLIGGKGVVVDCKAEAANILLQMRTVEKG
jgi:hypothetical protein